MHVASRLHVAQYVLLQVGHRFEDVGYILILLDISNDVGGFGSFGKVDLVFTFDYRGYAVFDKCQVGKVNALQTQLAVLIIDISQPTYQRKGCKEDSPDVALLGTPQSSWYYASTFSFVPKPSSFEH